METSTLSNWRKADGLFPFITFDGVDGAGKSTLVQTVSDRLSAVPFKIPPDELSDIRHFFDTQPSLESRFYYYLMCSKVVSVRVREVVMNSIAVSDRYYYTTVVSHLAAGLDPKLIDNIPPWNILSPDISFCLDCSDDDERERRLNKRGKSINDVRFSPLVTRIRELYHEFFPQMIFVDTAGKDRDEVASDIIDQISHRFYKG